MIIPEYDTIMALQPYSDMHMTTSVSTLLKNDQPHLLLCSHMWKFIVFKCR